jgi:polyisoprenoid-binding protein YceI
VVPTTSTSGSTSTTIDRRDFGISFNNELLDGQLNLGWDVTLAFSLEFARPELA